MSPFKLCVAALTVLGSALVALTITGRANWTVVASEPQPVTARDSADNEDFVEALLNCRETTIPADMPEEAASLVKSYDRSAAHIRREAACAIREERLTVMRRLKSLQDNYTRSAALDQAVAIRDTVRQMLEASYVSINNPGTMHAQARQIGKSFLVRVTGRTNGSIYGTDFFTYDSDIATACVHRGVLRDGETGIVIVKIVSTNQPHQGSTKHGIRSYDYGVYSASYTVRRWKPSIEEIELGSLKLE